MKPIKNRTCRIRILKSKSEDDLSIRSTYNLFFRASISEFVAVHNGIITNYKDIKQFLVWIEMNVAWTLT